MQQKAAQQEEKEKALNDKKNYIKSKAEKMTIEKFNKDFEQVMTDMKDSEDWTEGQRITFE